MNEMTAPDAPVATQTALDAKGGGSVGPIYNTPLIDSLPIGSGLLRQQMPSRSDLLESSERVAAGYEVLLSHYQRTLVMLEEFARRVRYADENTRLGAVTRQITLAVKWLDAETKKVGD